jgi:hypothetical protein
VTISFSGILPGELAGLAERGSLEYLAIGFILYFAAREPLPYYCPKCGMLVNARFNFGPPRHIATGVRPARLFIVLPN